jgi:hypothetical protein
VEDLSKLTPQDLQPSTCEAEYEADGPGKYVGTWPTCRHYVKGVIIGSLYFRSFSVEPLSHRVLRSVICTYLIESLCVAVRVVYGCECCVWLCDVWL